MSANNFHNAQGFSIGSFTNTVNNNAGADFTSFTSPWPSPGPSHAISMPSGQYYSTSPATLEQAVLPQRASPKIGPSILPQRTPPTSSPSTPLPLAHVAADAPKQMFPVGPTPFFKHSIISALSASSHLRSSMVALQLLFNNFGIKDPDWHGQVGFKQETGFSTAKQEIVITFRKWRSALEKEGDLSEKLTSLLSPFPTTLRCGKHVRILEATHERARKPSELFSPTCSLPDEGSLVVARRQVSEYRPRIMMNVSNNASSDSSDAPGDPKSQLSTALECQIEKSSEEGVADGSRIIKFTKLRWAGPEGYILREAYVTVVCDQSCNFRILPAERAEVDTKQGITQTNQKSRSAENTRGGQAEVTISSVSVGGSVSRTQKEDSSATECTTRNALQIQHSEDERSARVKYKKYPTLSDKNRLTLGDGEFPVFTVDPQVRERPPSTYTIRVFSIWDLDESQVKAEAPMKRVLHRFMGDLEAPGGVLRRFTNIAHCAQVTVASEFFGEASKTVSTSQIFEDLKYSEG
ncbi:hypothetical protein DFP72DRAFT_1173644 [Ephemerocybe angulata]|uniref:Uncharacterized protein n=1 Tax=Ephemerocybe angulata TaxID=980116 RepID=A0A8H6HLL2_9AGAR|nr:hypothetical protein DFP72DRAFT_1173644 [Tulosesus angulatus]